MKTALEQLWTLTPKTAGVKTGQVNAWLDEYTVIVWVAFANYGRVHHVTGDIKTYEGLLGKVRQKVVTAFQGPLAEQGVLYRDGGDIFIDDLKEHRAGVMYFSVRASGKWTEEQQDAITDSGALSSYIYGFKPMPS